MPTAYLREVCVLFNYHYVPIRRHLELHKHDKKFGASKPLRKARNAVPLPEPDDLILKHIFYFSHEDLIKQHRERQQKERKRKREEAEINGELLECGCCLDTFLHEDIAQCADGHLFCVECVRKAAYEVIGRGQLSFKCIEMGGCAAVFPDSVMQRVLPPSVFQSHMERVQADELRKVEISDLVSCPFCHFAIIMPDPNNKVLACQNPSCMKESCRLCREPNHIPLRCDEVIKQGQRRILDKLEEELTSALIRTCYKCKKRFFKEEGCNHMKCPCGAHMCYVCGKPLSAKTPYDHFSETDPSKCKMTIDTQKFNARRVAEAEKRVAQQAQSDPMAGSLDVQKLLNLSSKRRKRTRAEPLTII
eukprot:GILJ01007021.1.p1 GENE.GILJ01007021.1~~GILJ01007021.1.p1  ORF type:complete len:417 (-),score=44.31 GILJ01007021.1:74-1159(-)